MVCLTEANCVDADDKSLAKRMNPQGEALTLDIHRA